MSHERLHFEQAVERFLAETDLDFEAMDTDALHVLYFLLDHTLRGAVEDRRANLALILRERTA